MFFMIILAFVAFGGKKQQSKLKMLRVFQLRNRIFVRFPIVVQSKCTLASNVICHMQSVEHDKLLAWSSCTDNFSGNSSVPVFL